MNTYQDNYNHHSQRDKMKNISSASFELYQQQRNRLISLIERLLILAETLQSPTLLRELQDARSQLYANTLTILVAGELNAGKSTIINALLRAKVLPAYPVPTTALVTRIKRGAQPEVLLHRRPSHGSEQQPPLKVALNEMEPYLVFDKHNEQTDGLEEAEVFLPLPPDYDTIEFIDVIGPYDDDAYDETIENLAPSADVVLYALCCDAPASQEEALRIDWIKNMGKAALLFLCNHFDLVELRRQPRIRQHHLTHLCRLSSEDSIFFTNAKGALEGYLRGDMPQVAQSSIPQMEEALYNTLAAYGKQKMQPTIAELHALLRLSQQIVMHKEKFAHPALQTHADSLIQLHQECEWLEKEQQRVDDTFNSIRRRNAEETKSSAVIFFRECSTMLDNLIQSYAPQQPCSTWETFGGDAPERLAKHLIAFLTAAILNQFQSWLSFTLESLFQDERKIGSIGLSQDIPRHIAQVVTRRVNRMWHPSILIKRMIEDARQYTYLEPGGDEQVIINMISLYRSALDTSIDALVETIISAIDDELYQMQQALAHRLELQCRCLRDVAHRSLENERGQVQNNTIAVIPLFNTLEHELAAIEHEVSDL